MIDDTELTRAIAYRLWSRTYRRSLQRSEVISRASRIAARSRVERPRGSELLAAARHRTLGTGDRGVPE
jgi:hypothetical protein